LAARRGSSNGVVRQDVRQTVKEEQRESMAIIKAPPKQPKTTVVQQRLDDDAKMKLSKYAEFLECSPSYVVTEALKLVYQKDKEFQSWVSDQYSNNREPVLKGESLQLELK
jgi:predicted transcriptional regulator